MNLSVFRTTQGRRQALRRFERITRFGIVGMSGVLVNTAILWLLVRNVGLAAPLASVLATEAAILSNFALNDRWTFRDGSRQGSLAGRLLRFNIVSLGGLVITVAFLTALVRYSQLPLLLANLVAVGGAMTWNYGMNIRWTWRTSPAQKAARPAGRSFHSSGES
jgi:dolichol-phosphate mannosyltransferase